MVFPVDPSLLVLIVQFSGRTGPGQLRVFFDQQHIEYHILRVDLPFDQDQYSNASWRCIVVLGGPQAAYQDNDYPYIRWVKQLLTQHLNKPKPTPILAICLGCQILAEVVGGRAYHAKLPEMGYHVMHITTAGQTDPLLSTLQYYFSSALFVLHHGDTFTLPADIPVLLTTELHPQMFRYRSAIAIQSHPEAGIREFSTWLNADTEERMQQVGKTKAQVLKEVTEKRDEALAASEAFCAQWWKEVTAETTPPSSAPVSKSVMPTTE